MLEEMLCSSNSLSVTEVKGVTPVVEGEKATLDCEMKRKGLPGSKPKKVIWGRRWA